MGNKKVEGLEFWILFLNLQYIERRTAVRLNEKLQLRFAFVFLKIAKLRIYHESRNVLRTYVRGLILLYMVNRAFGDALGMYI